MNRVLFSYFQVKHISFLQLLFKQHGFRIHHWIHSSLHFSQCSLQTKVFKLNMIFHLNHVPINAARNKDDFGSNVTLLPENQLTNTSESLSQAQLYFKVTDFTFK